MSRATPHPRLGVIVATLRARHHEPRPPLPELREYLDRLSRRAPADIHVEPASLDETLSGVWLTPPDVHPNPTLLYLHGGGYVGGSIASHRELASRIARAAHARTFLLDYRLAPEHPHPAALNDATTALDVLCSRHGARHVALVGDSAGGGLALAALLRRRDSGSPMPARAVLLSPWLDLTLSGASVRERAHLDPLLSPEFLRYARSLYLGGQPAEQASPLFADLSGLPPLDIQVGTHEILFDDARRLAERATAAGLSVRFEPWNEQIHVFQLFAYLLPDGQEAIEDIGRWLVEGWRDQPG